MMMNDGAAEVPADGARITNLRTNDVLLGRGIGPSNFIGNKHFRDVIDERKVEYVSYDKYKPKARIAKEIFNKIRARGGRFLRLVEDPDGEPMRLAVAIEQGEWTEVSEKAALEKIKQCLREHRGEDDRVVSQSVHPPSGLPLGGLFGPANGGFLAESVPPTALQAMLHNSARVDPMMSSVLPPSMFRANNVGPSIHSGNADLFRPREHPIGFHRPRERMPPSSLAVAPSYDPYLARAILRAETMRIDVQDTFVNEHLPRHVVLQDLEARYLAERMRSHTETLPPTRAADSTTFLQPRELVPAPDYTTDSTPRRPTRKLPKATPKNTATPEPEREDAIHALAVLAVSNEPKFTKEDLEQEEKAMSDEERAEILSDMFGAFCTVDSSKRPDKRARRDLDDESIEFLINFMRNEIDKIPDDQKGAYLSALAKCGADSPEFSNERLESFLRAEKMNAKHGAERFVSYFQARLEVFGEEKFALPMTLGGAFRDDLPALSSTTYYVLPETDVSGRPILFSLPRGRGGKGLSTQSILRIFWYASEVMSQGNTDAARGYVHVVWMAGAGVWDFDIAAYKRLIYFERSCWPVRVVANHICCPPQAVIQVVKPIMFFLMRKRVRSRNIVHDVPESEIIDVLESYGILEDMLPTDIGGTISFSQSEWLEDRRAVELEDACLE